MFALVMGYIGLCFQNLAVVMGPLSGFSQAHVLYTRPPIGATPPSGGIFQALWGIYMIVHRTRIPLVQCFSTFCFSDTPSTWVKNVLSFPPPPPIGQTSLRKSADWVRQMTSKVTLSSLLLLETKSRHFPVNQRSGKSHTLIIKRRPGTFVLENQTALHIPLRAIPRQFFLGSKFPHKTLQFLPGVHVDPG